MMKVVPLARDAASAPRPEAERAVDQEIDQGRRLGGDLGQRGDRHREVAERTLERMKADDFAALRRYAATRACALCPSSTRVLP